MSKTLVLAEKPSVARDIARVLGVRSSAEGYMESDEWVVTWALGHLVALCEPDGIDPRYKAWRMETLPILPDSIPLQVLEKTKSQFGIIKKLMHRRDIGRVVCATDSGREGELIFRYIYAQAECKKPFVRLWISSMTDEAIRDGFMNLRPGSEYDNLYQSARCRSEADWLVGMNASRAYSVKYNAWLSIGRVQTPTLALVCSRDSEINAFVPENYFEVRALFGDLPLPEAAPTASEKPLRINIPVRPIGNSDPTASAFGAPSNDSPVNSSDGFMANADAILSELPADLPDYDPGAPGGYSRALAAPRAQLNIPMPSEDSPTPEKRQSRTPRGAKDDFEPQSGEYMGVWLGSAPENPTRISSETQAREISDYVAQKPAVVDSVSRKEQQLPPPQLYDLTTLQRDANRLLGLSAKQTLDTVQVLYERHKLLTYPRTDSRCLTHDMAAEVPKILGLLPSPYKEMAAPLSALENIGANKRVFDDSKVSDHHAIIPTKKSANLNSLNSTERAVYDLVARRLIAALYPAYRFVKVEVITTVAPHRFLSKGTVPLEWGWKSIYRGVDEDERDPLLPELSKGDMRLTRKSQSQSKKTQPPKPYTDATLLQAMENAGRNIEDDELKQAMKDSGLGTPATRAATIERLLEVGYCGRSGKALKASQKAFQLMQILPDQLKSAETTGKWERALGRIARGEGQITPEAFIDSIRRFATFIVDSARQNTVEVTFEREEVSPKRSQVHYLTGAKCPVCGARMIENARAYGCEKWREGCKFTIWKNSLTREGLPEINGTAARKLLKGEDAELGGKLIRLINGRPSVVGNAPPKPAKSDSAPPLA